MKKYNRDFVEQTALEYFNGDTLARDVWLNKYALKDSEGNIYETSPVDMHKRISSELSRIEQKYPNPIPEEQIFDLIKDFKYIIPQGGSMSGIGNNLQTVSLSNCFVIGNESDSYGGITLTDQQQVQLMKRRGGVGHDLSHLRPKGTSVKNSALTSTGVVPFMERYSNSTREVAQDGRRGALMLSLKVKHPDAEDFIDAKMEAGKVTGANISVKLDDIFMKAAIAGEPYTQQFPVESTNPSITKDIDAKKLWKKIIHNAWKSAEPGLMFWDTITKEAIPDCYAEHGFKTVSTNPCVVGDTLISVADGRKYVSIKQLVEEGKDIPVYALDNNGKIVIRTMRHPRLTGHNQQIYKVNIEGGHSQRVTGNHKFRLNDGTYKQTKDLMNGDSLHIMTNSVAAFNDIFKNSKSKSQDYNWLSTSGKNGYVSEHKVVAEFNNGVTLKTGEVVHHIDYNGMNNSPNNLKIMYRIDHDKLHSIDMIGEKNPYHRMSDEWKAKFATHVGEENGRYINVSNEDIIVNAKKLTKTINRRFSKNDWIEYAKNNNLPQHFSIFREKKIGSVMVLSKKVALDLGYDNVDTDPRLVKTYKNALENGYDAEIVGNEVLVYKTCEECGNIFNVNYLRREISFCSNICSLNHTNNDKIVKEKRTNSVNSAYKEKGNNKKEKQVKVYSDLKFKLGRNPFIKEWENECKKLETSYRLKTKYGFQKYSDLKEEAEYYNHKVISVELDGCEDVYNGTVDDFHNFFSGGFEEINRYGKTKYVNINQLQCGEIPLNPYDSCRLLALNLYSYVVNPFTPEAYFDYELFAKHAQIAQRFMDDIVDLEIEKIDAILEKIINDPEPDEVKVVETNLWEKIKEKAIQGRRTGLGITAEGDMLAALGIKYGTSEGTEVATEVHKVLALNSYTSSIIMAKERGSFTVWDLETESDNPFIKRIMAELDDEMIAMYTKYGRRNIASLTIAPTGSVSIMTQTTSGIEPVFMVSYMRRRKINPNDKETKASFVDEIGDSWIDYNVFHPMFKVWASTNGYDVDTMESLSEADLNKIIEKSPYYGATSNDVDWVQKVIMQGSIQKWIDHSISVTVNLPNNATEETVSKVYEMGWKSGCKGITVYRDGSRSGVLVAKSEEKKNDIFTENDAPKRGKKLKCDVIRFQNKGEKWIGFLGLIENRPYEIFTGLQDAVNIPTTITSGEIVKIKNAETDGSSRYDFVYNDKDGYEQEFRGLSRAFNREFANVGKLISGVLRHGMPLPNVITLVKKMDFGDSDIISSWKNGITRMIKKYIKEGTAIKGQVCTECGQDTMVFKEGCMSCTSCGHSKCE